MSSYSTRQRKALLAYLSRHQMCIRDSICSALREKFGEKNPEMQVLH